MPEFHHRDGWRFERLEDGSVAIRNDVSTGRVNHVIPAAEWAKIVAHVSAASGSYRAESFAQALHLHGPPTRELPTEPPANDPPIEPPAL